MSTAELKTHLHQLIDGTSDNSLLAKVFALLSKTSANDDWADELPPHIIEEITLAMQEIDNGNDVGIPHEVMLEKFRKEFPSLNI